MTMLNFKFKTRLSQNYKNGDIILECDRLNICMHQVSIRQFVYLKIFCSCKYEVGSQKCVSDK